MLILSLLSGAHNSSAALFDDDRLVAAVAEERLSRVKGAGGLPERAVAEVLRLAGAAPAAVGQVVSTPPHGVPHADPRPRLAALGLSPVVPLFVADHHLSHALPGLFFTDWPNGLVSVADGTGDRDSYGHWQLKGGRLTRLGGAAGEARLPSGSVGLAYGFVTEALGWQINRHEGKLTGLAAHGRPTLLPAMLEHFRVAEDGRIEMDFTDAEALRRFLAGLAATDSRENAAASVQALLEHCITRSLSCLLARAESRHLALAGGVFANVRLNRHLADSLPLDEIFIVPPMGDEGLVIGGALQFLLERDGLAAWLGRRRRLTDLYWGGDHDAEVPPLFDAAPNLRRLDGDPAAVAAERLAAGGIGAIYHGRMEYGPRALGARSILASPARAEVNDSLNRRLDRSDFMPFAPVVAEADAPLVFDIGPVNRYAASFMTITCGVRQAWRQRIPAVVHVDGSARPQVIRRRDNPLYFDILAAFKARTGLPVLVNTSFNVHEEPIINRPEECLRALADGRVDFVVTRHGAWTLR